MLTRQDAIKDIFNWHGQDSIYITNTGFISRDVYSLFPKNKNIFYMQGSMGLSPCIGLGIAANSQKDVVVISGDASLLMHLGSMFTAGFNNKTNVKHILLNNNSHESVGGQITNADKINFNNLSKSLGYKYFYKISKENEIESTLTKFLKNKDCSLLEVRINSDPKTKLPRPKDLIKIKNNFLN